MIEYDFSEKPISASPEEHADYRVKQQ